MHALLVAAVVLLPFGLIGCSDLLGEVPEGCGDERTHHVDQQDSPASHAEVAPRGDQLVYLWEIKVTNACKAEHVAIDWKVVLNEAFDDVCDVPRVVGSAYQPGSFLSARTVEMSPSGSRAERTYQGETSYGLKQAAGAEDAPVAYTVDVEVQYSLADEQESRDCASSMIRGVEIKAVDRVDK